MTATPPAPTLNKRVLVVDDDETNRDLACHILRMSRLDVDVAPSGRAALRMYEDCWKRGEPYDVVVTDLVMPGMSGTDLAGALLDRGASSRLVCVTGRVAPTTLDMCASAGFDVVLTKPYRMSSLLLAVMGQDRSTTAAAVGARPLGTPAFA
jgi:CheY-like chemotaxis protein